MSWLIYHSSKMFAFAAPFSPATNQMMFQGKYVAVIQQIQQTANGMLIFKDSILVKVIHLSRCVLIHHHTVKPVLSSHPWEA